MISVRDAALADAERILSIYNYYVQNTAITFEYDTPSLPEFQGRMRQTMSRYPYLVIEQDGVIQGYAYAGPFQSRAAYGWCCEMTVYLDRGARKRGLGRRLYEALEARLRAMGVLNLYACIAYPEAEDEYLTANSADFHAHLGFTKVGEFHKCGYKFGRWYNMIWMEKLIGARTDPQPPVDRVDAVRQDEQMEGMYMSTELFEMELREKGREEGLKEGMEKGMERGMETTLLANIRCLIETMQLSAEQAMNALRVPAEDRARLSAQL